MQKGKRPGPADGKRRLSQMESTECFQSREEKDTAWQTAGRSLRRWQALSAVRTRGDGAFPNREYGKRRLSKQTEPEDRFF